MFFTPSPASNVSSPSKTTSKERGFIVDSGASLHMMGKSDLTPEEQLLGLQMELLVRLKKQQFVSVTWRFLFK